MLIRLVADTAARRSAARRRIARRIIGARHRLFPSTPAALDYIRTGAVADLRAQLSNAWDADLRIEGERTVHEPAPGSPRRADADQHGLRLLVIRARPRACGCGFAMSPGRHTGSGPLISF